MAGSSSFSTVSPSPRPKIDATASLLVERGSRRRTSPVSCTKFWRRAITPKRRRVLLPRGVSSHEGQCSRTAGNLTPTFLPWFQGLGAARDSMLSPPRMQQAVVTLSASGGGYKSMIVLC